MELEHTNSVLQTVMKILRGLHGVLPGVKIQASEPDLNDALLKSYTNEK